METIAAVLFALAALGGLVMAVNRFRGQPRPNGLLAAGHGVLAGAGVVVYLVALLGAEDPPALGVVALVVFVAAALGGAALVFGFHLRQQTLPIWLVATHGVVAVIAYVLLLAAIIGVGADAGAGAPGY